MTFEFAKSLFLLIFKNYQIIPSDSELNVHFKNIQRNFHTILEGFDLSKKINFQMLFFEKSEKNIFNHGISII